MCETVAWGWSFYVLYCFYEMYILIWSVDDCTQDDKSKYKTKTYQDNKKYLSLHRYRNIILKTNNFLENVSTRESTLITALYKNLNSAMGSHMTMFTLTPNNGRFVKLNINLLCLCQQWVASFLFYFLSPSPPPSFFASFLFLSFLS